MAASIHFHAAIPQFTVKDVKATAEYYRNTLGFEIAGYWGEPPVFGIVRRGDVEFFFNTADESEVKTGRARGGYDAYIRITGIDDLAAELGNSGADILEGPTIREYGQRELVIKDCNGLVLAFGEESSVIE